MSPRNAFTPPATADAASRRWLNGQLRPRRRTAQLVSSIAHPVVPALPVQGWWSARQTAPTSGWMTAWQCLIERLVNEELVAFIPYATFASSTLEVRLAATPAGAPTVLSGVQSVGANQAGSLAFQWAHGLAPWTTLDVTVAIEINVPAASFSSPVDVFPPYGGGIIERCSVTGAVVNGQGF